MKNPKKKGNAFELRCAKQLTERFGSAFSRSPNSGAFGTTHESAQLMGDLITPQNFRFSVECKSGYNLDFQCFFADSGHRRKLLSFFKQAAKDANAQSKQPMVIYKKNNRAAWAFIRDESWPQNGPDEYVVVAGWRGAPIAALLLMPYEFFFEAEGGAK